VGANGGIVTRSTKALRYALGEDLPAMAGEVAWLTDAQLEQLIQAAHRMGFAASAELRGRKVPDAT
jgi:hypothetical protein